MKKQCRRDKNKTKQKTQQQRRLKGTEPTASSDLTETSPVERCRRKKANVCLLSPVLTSSLPPLSPSAPPVLAVHPVPFAEPAGAPLHAAVQRQPQHPQSDKLPRLLQWGVLPAADRTDPGDGEPRGQRSVAVRCEGPGVLHRGPKGKISGLSLVALWSARHLPFQKCLKETTQCTQRCHFLGSNGLKHSKFCAPKLTCGATCPARQKRV